MEQQDYNPGLSRHEQSQLSAWREMCGKLLPDEAAIRVTVQVGPDTQARQPVEVRSPLAGELMAQLVILGSANETSVAAAAAAAMEFGLASALAERFKSKVTSMRKLVGW